MNGCHVGVRELWELSDVLRGGGEANHQRRRGLSVGACKWIGSVYEGFTEPGSEPGRIYAKLVNQTMLSICLPCVGAATWRATVNVH
jgi:hypothetical protein